MDEFEEDIAGHKRARLRGVKDEYSSESEEDSDVEAETQLKPQDHTEVKENDSDSDMFASEDEEHDSEVKQGAERKTNVLDIKQFNKEAEIEDQNSDKEETVYDNYDKVQDYYNNVEQDRTGVTSKYEPKIEAFNLKHEEEEGHFDNDGHFIREKESEDEDWISSIKKSDIEEARKAQQLREARLDSKLHINETTAELIAVLLEVLEPDETPMEALARFAPKKSRKKKEDNDAQRKQVVSDVTDACSKLSIAKGMDDVFDLTREELMRKYTSETGRNFSSTGGTKRPREDDDTENYGNDDNNDYGAKLWEYRWLDEQEVNGPYSDYEMNYWKDTHFNNNVEVRKVGETTFTHINEITFNL